MATPSHQTTQHQRAAGGASTGDPGQPDRRPTMMVDSMTESRDADRLTAYSDSVFAVIVTIMVLQLKTPASAHLSALLKLWQPLISYVVSYVFIAIIWINHHYLTRLTRTATLPIIWINFIHLFVVSLVPFTTSWMAETKLAAAPVVVYAAVFVCADGAYNLFERRVLRECDMVTERQRRVARYRSLSAFALFSLAAVVAAFVPWAGFGLICLALLLHVKPDVGTSRLAPDVSIQREGLAPALVNPAKRLWMRMNRRTAERKE